jgi:hypothetical protein
MLFQKRQDFRPVRSGLALGGNYSEELTREFHIEALLIKVKATVSGAIATATADGLLGLLKSVTLTVSDGGVTRIPVNSSGRGLIEYFYQTAGALDRNTLLAKDKTTTGSVTITYPILFSNPQLSDPVSSVFLLPAPRFNSNPVLQLNFATQADVDSNNSPTFAVSALSYQVVVIRRVVNIANFPSYNCELAELAQSYPATGAGQLYELQNPGSYTGILLRTYTSATTRGDVSIANGEFKLQLLSTVLRRMTLEDLQIENDFSQFPYDTTKYFDGCYFLDFLTDRVGADSDDTLGSILDANITSGSGARIQLLQDITGGAGVQIKYLSNRVFGDLRLLKRPTAKK